MTIYDIAKIKCRTFIESINTLFSMGKELEQEVDGIETSIGTSDDEASSSGSLWARIKYALANMVATSGAQTIADVKTFTSSPKVPTSPASIDSAVNQSYVESTVDGVNNILHKSGNETKTGKLTLSYPIINGLSMMKQDINEGVSGKWVQIFRAKMASNNYITRVLITTETYGGTPQQMCDVFLGSGAGSSPIVNRYVSSDNGSALSDICVTVDENDKLILWFKSNQYGSRISFRITEFYSYYGENNQNTFENYYQSGDGVIYDNKPTTADGYVAVRDGISFTKVVI